MRILLTDIDGVGSIIVDTHRIIYVADIAGGAKICLSIGEIDIVVLEVAESAAEIFELCDEM